MLPGCWWFSGPSKVVVGSGNRIRESRPIKKVNELEVAGSGIVFLRQGSPELLIVEADDNLMPYIITESDRGKLSIAFEHNVQVKSKQPIKYFLTLHEINVIELSGAVYLKAERIKAEELTIESSGASRIDATIFADELDIEGTGASKWNLQGTVKKQNVEIAGAAQYNAGSMQSETCKVDVTGSARVVVNVSKDLSVRASGVAFVAYKGDPQVDIKTSSASSVKKVG